MNTSSRVRLAVAFTACLALSGREALAIDNGACCVQSTSKLETLMNPNRGSDENFFSSAGGPPNVLVIVDTSGSMENWMTPWPTSKGCYSQGASGHASLSGYDQTKTYPGLYTGFTGTGPTEHSRWFDRSKVYTVPSGSFGNDFSSSGAPSGTTTFNDNTAACATVPLADRPLCNTCLTNDGYYVQSSSSRLARGNYLNYYGPRDYAAIASLSHIIYTVREVRMAVMTITKYGSGGARCFANAGSGSNCACILDDFSPSCDKSFPLDSSSVDSNRNSLLGKLATGGTWSGCGTPLADMMYAGAHWFRSLPPSDGFTANGISSYPTDTDFNEPATGPGSKKSVCAACGFNSIILISDGEPTDENLSIPAAIGTPAIGSPQCTGAYCGSKVDEVARWLWTKDLRADYPGKQSVATYTIGIALSPDATKLLQSTATAGGGTYFPANRAEEIEANIVTILSDVISRNTSFASAAVASVQTGSSSTPALLPRMLPKKSQPWEGSLWRFNQYNEFVEDADLNGDGDKEDVFIVEDTGAATPTVANIVTEAPDGTFVKNGTNNPANEFWEANKRLVADLSTNVDNRKVWTVLDSNGDGAFTNADGLVAFKPDANAANDLRMAEYLGLRSSPLCPSAAGPGIILTKLGSTVANAVTASAGSGFLWPVTPVQADYDRLCARMVMRWVLGGDLLDADGDGSRVDARPRVLGDIFHSSPVVAEPPIDAFLCELGLANQCTRTLFSESLGVTHTPHQYQAPSGPAAPTGCVAGSVNAYEGYAYEQRRRDKLALVGANDGMVHAFVTGRFVSGSENCVGGKPVGTFDQGNGREVWAFIPPDMLPKLADQMLGHEYLVDGDIMLRDIWADGSGSTGADGQKQKDEFHTLAVISEGRGGKHYFALEVFDSSTGALDRPQFRWMFPQPCSEESALFGKTFLSISPKPPPIGPVLINTAGLPGGAGAVPTAGAIPRYTVNTIERWVVALSGGWTPGLERGRGVYVVDAWQGQINGRRDNLWWKFEFNESASGINQPAKELTNSVSAPVALVDYGSNAVPAQDGFFDTAIFGDTVGQLWVTRLHEPGTFNASTNRINNWYTARAFEMDRDGVPAAASGSTLEDGGVEPADPNAKSMANKSPFFYLPSVAMEPGTNRLRVFAGTGNRYALLESGAGHCRFDNPVACAKVRCNESKIVSKYKDAVVDTSGETHWKSRRFEHGKVNTSVSIAPTVAALSAIQACGTVGGKRVEASNEDFKVKDCNMSSGPNTDPGDVDKIKYECGLNTAGTSFTCTLNGTPKQQLDDLLDNSLAYTAGLGRNRFIGVWAYGGTQSDGGTRAFGASAMTPQQFDADRKTDRSSSNSVSGDLIDVTQVGCTANGQCDGGASATDFGWFVDYSQLAQKTATGAAVLASCVLWSDLTPTGGDGGLCGSSVTPLSQVYQGDFITGQPNCAFSFRPTDGGAFTRSQARTVVAPPPEPASVVQVSKTGQVRYSAMIVEPGQDQATNVNVSGGQDVLQLVYEVPVSRSMHNCRHADGGCFTMP